MSTTRDLLQRRVGPGVVVALSRISWPARLGAGLRRATGRRGRVELFFAFDDPCSAIALTELSGRLASRRVALVLRPVLERGIPGDPAVPQKRRYAIEDASRLARRAGLELGRSDPLPPQDARFVAEWAASAPQGPSLERFCLAATGSLWLERGAAIDRDRLATLWREQFGQDPAPADGPAALARNERLMKRRGPYDVPAAWVHGRWYFAHDRPAQICEWLDQLGWRAS